MNSKSEQHHLLILSIHYEAYKDLIEAEHLPGLTITALREPEQAIKYGNDYDLIFGEPSLIQGVINLLPEIHWVQSSWAGVEPLLAPGLRRGYILTNAREVYGAMMAEYVFGYLLMIERRILSRWQSQQQRTWDVQLAGSLKGKCLGLLGVGTIGSYLAGVAHQFGMQVHGYTRQSESCDQVDRYFHEAGWREFGGNLDYLVNTLPGTPATVNTINAPFFARLPQRTWLINIGRGSAVDETALVEALRANSISGAVLDVVKEEPLPEDHPLWTTPNTILTFHTAAKNHPPDIAAIFISNYRRYIHGEPLKYQVDFERGY